MSRPITWQNVRGPDPIEALRGIQVAQQMGSSAFDQFGKIIQNAQATDEANWNKVKENNTQEFLNKVFAVQGADKFKAMQESGELERMIAANGAQIDRAAARSALDGRLTTLQQRDRAAWDFNNAQLDQKEAPTIDAIKASLAKGDLAGAKPLIASLSARGQANTLSLADARERELLLRTRGDKEFGWKEAGEAQNVVMRPLEVAARRASINASNASAAASVESVARSKDERKYLSEDRAALRVSQERERLAAIKRAEDTIALQDNTFERGGVFGAGDVPALLERWSKLREPNTDESTLVASMLSKIAKEGITANDKGGKRITKLPKEAVEAALLSAESGWFGFRDASYSENLAKELRSKLFGVTKVKDANGKEVEVYEDRVAKDWEEFEAVRTRRKENPELPKQAPLPRSR